MSSPSGARAAERPGPDVQRRIVSGTARVREALDQVRLDCAGAGADDALNTSAQIVLAEVLNNVVEHAYLYAEGHPIDVSIWIREDGLWCEVVDEGHVMPDGTPPAGIMPNIDASAPGTLPEGGFGWAMVRRMTRDIEYARQNNRNHLGFLIPA